MPQKTHYDTLGIDGTASAEDIKKAYRKLSLKLHPDKPSGDEEKFKELGAAYEILSDAATRRNYDMGGGGMGGGGMGGGTGRNHPFASRRQGHGGVGAQPPFGGMFSPDDIFSSLFQGRGQFQGGQFPDPFSTHMGQSAGNPHIRIFRNGVHVNVPSPTPDPIVQTISITLKQSYEGESIPVNISRTIVRNQEKVSETETIYVDIPKGMSNNEMIVVKEMGNVINGTKSDLKIKIVVTADGTFTRDGLNIMYQKQISLKDALCGFVFELPFINGKVYTINNTSGNIMSPNFLKEIPNMGFTRGSNVGKLIIKFVVVFPTTLPEETIEKLKDLL